MEIIIGSMKTTEDMEQSVTGASEQQKNASEGQKETKIHNDSGKQQTSYDAISKHGDTFSVSEAGKVASSGKGNKLVKADTTDGIVIQKSTVNL